MFRDLVPSGSVLRVNGSYSIAWQRIRMVFCSVRLSGALSMAACLSGCKTTRNPPELMHRGSGCPAWERAGNTKQITIWTGRVSQKWHGIIISSLLAQLRDVLRRFLSSKYYTSVSRYCLKLALLPLWNVFPYLFVTSVSTGASEQQQRPKCSETKVQDSSKWAAWSPGSIGLTHCKGLDLTFYDEQFVINSLSLWAIS